MAPRRSTRAYLLVIASQPREGRVMRQVRRCFIAAGLRPLVMADFLAWAYPHLTRFKHWHRWSCRRALLHYAVPIGRSREQGTPVIWAPRRDMARNMAREEGKTPLLCKALSRDD